MGAPITLQLIIKFDMATKGLLGFNAFVSYVKDLLFVLYKDK